MEITGIKMGVIKNFFEKITGIDKIKAEAIAEAVESIRVAKESVAAAEEAKEIERLTKLSPKELASEKKEPWVCVLNTHVNSDNIKNGFFELDWNEYFILELTNAGYTGSTEEEIVDKWFSELCRNIGSESNVNMDRRGSGFINVNNLGNGRTEMS